VADPLKPPSGGEFGDEIESSEVPAWFLKNLTGALKAPMFSVPKPFETWMIDKVASSGFQLPISQLVGYGQTTAAAKVMKNAAQSLTDLTETALTWQTEVFDKPDGSMFDSGASTRLTCRAEGRYIASVLVVFAAAAGGVRDVFITKNGGATRETTTRFASLGAGSATFVTAFTPLDLVVDDYVEAFAYQDSGAAVNVLSAQTHFSLARVA